MDNIKGIITGTILTLIVGGTAYTISQSDVIKNFANDTGLTQEQAEEYVNSIKEEDLAPWDEVGAEFVKDGQDIISISYEIDCANYEYEWESTTLSCYEARSQIQKIGRDSIALGESYIRLSLDSASIVDMQNTIDLIDQMNFDYELQVLYLVLDSNTINEYKKNNSYNKALLKTALESE